MSGDGSYTAWSIRNPHYSHIQIIKSKNMELQCYIFVPKLTKRKAPNKTGAASSHKLAAPPQIHL